MAKLSVQTTGFDGVIGLVAGIERRVERLPAGWELSTRSKLAVIHHLGGRQTVSRRVQRGIAAKTRVAPPRVGTVMIHPARPVRATDAMAAAAAKQVSLFAVKGGSIAIEPIMRKDVNQQFASGGRPGWVASRDWGEQRARKPTLGGASGRVGVGWAAATFRERR